MHAGFDVAGRHYDFLAYSNSQLRKQSCWFYDSSPQRYDKDRSNQEVTSADQIRHAIGDLSAIEVRINLLHWLNQAHHVHIAAAL
jgi:hypothetical protein